MIWLWLASLALATRVEADLLPCPMGDEPARVYRLLAKDSYAGWDADGARYALRGQWRSYAVATCPNNYLSLTAGDMREPLSPEQQLLLAPLLAELAVEISDPEKLEVWDRWVLAARAYELLDRDPWFIANVYLQASWTVRDAAVGVFEEGLQGPSHARAYLVAGEEEYLRPELTDDQRKVLAFNLAKIAHRGGFAEERENLLKLLRQQSLNSAETAALRALERAVILEPQLQDRARPHLTAVVNDNTRTDEQRNRARFLLAELDRRAGRLDAAATGFEEVKRNASDDPPLLALSTYLAAESRGETPWKHLQAPVSLDLPAWDDNTSLPDAMPKVPKVP